ncbi:MAG: hypothetical protein ACRCXX_12610 [Cetobacterium sp.]
MKIKNNNSSRYTAYESYTGHPRYDESVFQDVLKEVNIRGKEVNMIWIQL